MPDPLSTAERYRSDAAKFSELSKDAVNPFFRDYYKRLSQRYLMHAKIRRGSRGSPKALQPAAAKTIQSLVALAFKPLQEPFRRRKCPHPPNLLRRHLCSPLRIQFVPLGESGADV